MSAQYDFKLTKGSKFRRTLLFKDAAGAAMNLTGYTARLRLRAFEDDADALDVSTASGELVVAAAEGKLVLTLSATQVDALPFVSGVYRLDLIDPATDPEKLLHGAVLVSEGF